MSDVFKTLSAINANEYKEKKGKFDYLPWTDAWTILMQHYPDATHDMLEDVHYPDGSMEVRSSVTINGQTLKMFLPVIDHKNNAITNPNAFDINKNRMRCLVKNIALFGLGIYIFQGEDLPAEPRATESDWEDFLKLIATKDAAAVTKYMAEIGNTKADDLFNMAPKGHKTKFKDAVRQLQTEFASMVDGYVNGLSEGVNDPSAVVELIAELDDPFVKQRVWAQLSPVVQQQIKDILKEAA